MRGQKVAREAGGGRVRVHHLHVAEPAVGASMPVLDRTVTPRHPGYRNRREIDQSREVVGINADAVHELTAIPELTAVPELTAIHELTEHVRIELAARPRRHGKVGRCPLPPAPPVPWRLWFEPNAA
ncbi:hypothetical protein FraQA3DRAFT_2276 [Frankia sp. QA3]|nr:hypothetical protein FraQA3DRAFT_2276 [Frankia sp. QA3]